MQCTSQYPCSLKNVGPNIFFELKKKFKIPVGFSDHTLGFSASAYAASNGVKVIEKHFTLSKKMYGSDAKHSMEPKDFKAFSKIIKEIWFLQKFKINKNNIKNVKEMKYIFEKSIVFKKNLPKGKKISKSDLSFKKPSKGIKPKFYKNYIGKVLKRAVSKDDFLSNKLFV